ncbi:MAG TPA: hypothetical protein ENK50_03730 [Sedimenticola sp.]|nr:hypothetical protein [Sedimenticola sp.]
MRRQRELDTPVYYSTLSIVMDEPLRRRLRNMGWLLVLLGGLGILLPKLVSVTISFLIASLLLLSGLIVGYFTWYSYNRSGLAWLKPFTLVVLGLLILIHPLAGAAALGLILFIYFLLDGFAGVSFALALKPTRGWAWTLVSGIASLLLAAILIAGWPFSSLWLVGLMVSISLLFNGIALLMLTRP